MDDKYFDISETMVEYSEMSGFDFANGCYKNQEINSLKQAETLHKNTFDVLDVLKTMFKKTSLQKN